jgi:ATP-dependent Clp endopeptidase proteolytic subunit ClpP
MFDLREAFRGQMPDVITTLRAKTAEHAQNAPRREAGYTIQNATGDVAVVRIYDEIWDFGVNALELVAELDTITAPTMRVEINSPGGSVFDGIAIYNALRTHPAHVTTRVDGIAASIASVIAQAGDHRIMVDSSQMMIHNAWGMVVGNQSDHEDMAALLSQQDSIIAGVYASRSGGDADHFRDLMNAETWMTADAAVAEGLADEVLTPGAPQDKAPSLGDKIASAVNAVDEAVSSAETVSAIRAEAGKTLSTTISDSLSGLRDAIERIDGLLPTAEPDEHPDVVAARLALARRALDFRAALPVG